MLRCLCCFAPISGEVGYENKKEKNGERKHQISNFEDGWKWRFLPTMGNCTEAELIY